MGCVYILPENSLYSSINAFLDIENELVNFIEKDMKCALVGDFNPKTTNISLKRYTQCECRPNNFGRKLLEMCKSALAIFEKYCYHWKLKINLQKTKVIIFCKRK